MRNRIKVYPGELLERLPRYPDAGVPSGGSDLDALFPVRVLQVVGLSGGGVVHDGTLAGNGSSSSPLSVTGSGATTPTYIGGSKQASAAGGITLSSTLDAGTIQEGDLLLAIVNSNTMQAPSNNTNFIPQGWKNAFVDQLTNAAGASACGALLLESESTGTPCGLFWKHATGNETNLAAYTFGSAISAGLLLCIRGGYSFHGLSVMDHVTTDGVTGAMAMPTIITTKPNQLSILVISGNIVITTPSGVWANYTKNLVQAGAGGVNFGLQAWTQLQTSAGVQAGGSQTATTAGTNYGAFAVSIGAD